jgi:hypothetical protein
LGRRFAKCAIVAVNNVPLSEPYLGNLRKEDVRAVKKDSVIMCESVRCGDVIVARVVSFSIEKYIPKNKYVGVQ